MSGPDSAAVQLLVHGGIVLLIGILCGIPFGRSIARHRPEDALRAWRVAHSSLISGGVMMEVVGLALPVLGAAPMAAWFIAVSLIVSGYAFALALPVGAAWGVRGITMRPPAANRFVFLGNAIGSLGSLLGALGFVSVAISRALGA